MSISHIVCKGDNYTKIPAFNTLLKHPHYCLHNVTPANITAHNLIFRPSTSPYGTWIA